MGGTNPYIQKPEVKKAEKKFCIQFSHFKKPIEVDPKNIPMGETGLPGSVLDIALGNGVDIDHACGGVCACSTCHVYITSGLESCSQPTEAEQDMLDLAADVRPNSRLSCQCVADGTKDLVVEIPSWNRNLIKERPHT